ncbi:MAG: exopolysaccharide biosynthesis polyprenyl glycosylphosphotransferase [Pseudobacteriovorax sp.]|nr:exopolysaccharide biosynthesis polyprenyl glycosylphosphotransferase [Pseudobacteriovorax sp.]
MEKKPIKSKSKPNKDVNVFIDIPRQINRSIEPLLVSGVSRLPQKIKKTKYQGRAKRLFDIFGASMGLLALAPFLVVIVLLIKRGSRGPAIFTQNRVGKGGRLFKIYKFRTMYADAERRKKDLLLQNEVKGPAFKMKNDPRITPLGRILRKYSIDELPQLFNVLKGDMSLVGPRPALVDEIRKWEHGYFRRLSVQQGLTCIWQVSGRSDITFEQWMEMDLDYVENWSMSLDIKLIIKTVFVVFKGQGAY